LFGSQIKDLIGSFAGAFVPVSLMLLLAIILPAVTRKPVTVTGQQSDPASEAGASAPERLPKHAQTAEEGL
jgi:hypothetical protein